MTEAPSIALPVRVTLGDSYSIIRACSALEQAPDGVVLDASQTIRFEPVVAAMLAATAADRRSAGLSTRWSAPLDEEAAHWVSEVQMDRVIRGGRLTVMSMRAKVAWNAGAQIISKSSQFFRGTAIEIDFRPGAPVVNPDEYVPVF